MEHKRPQWQAKLHSITIDDIRPDIVIFNETKMKRPIIPHVDIGSDEYDVIQVKSTMHGRGGMAVLARKELQITTTEVLREEGRNYFIRTIVLTDKKNEAIVGWYNSPGTSRQNFQGGLKRIMRIHDVRCLAGDLIVRHPRWCTAHGDHRRGKQLLKMVN